jgi:two-component system alkaline phosphatase synthesis response regulator PhoP
MKPKITLIDDERGLINTIKGLLEERGFEVSFAYDGNSGIDVVKKELPDVVVLDIMMPGRDGRDVLKELKKNEDTKHIPVIMLTAKDEQFDRDNLLQIGAYEYIAKPYDSYALLRQIKNVLEKSGR